MPDFAQIVVIPFENREFDEGIGNHQMPNYNLLAAQYTLLTQYYTIQHPSLPDQIESFGRTWKAYMEDMPSSCFIGNKGNYVQKHDPFIYFDSIRLDTARCQRSVVPLTDLSTDLTSGVLPDFAYSMPNLCNSAHNATSLNPFCSLGTVDDWLGKVVQKL